MSDDGVAEDIFQDNVVSARSVAAFARNGQPVDAVDEAKFDTGAGATDPNLFRARDLRGNELTDTIGALGGKGPARPTSRDAAKPKALLTFWATPGASDDAGVDTGVSAQAATAAAAAIAGGASPGNVLIPLPAAVWSALSIMGGAGALAGVRKIRRRLR